MRRCVKMRRPYGRAVDHEQVGAACEARQAALRVRHVRRVDQRPCTPADSPTRVSARPDRVCGELRSLRASIPRNGTEVPVRQKWERSGRGARSDDPGRPMSPRAHRAVREPDAAPATTIAARGSRHSRRDRAWVSRIASMRRTVRIWSRRSRVASTSSDVSPSTSSDVSVRRDRPTPGVPPLAPVPRKTRRVLDTTVASQTDEMTVELAIAIAPENERAFGQVAS